MARILCVTNGMTSVVYSVLKLARRLWVDGHEVTFAGTPDRRELAHWLPQLRVLERADVAVVHGGIHTIDECILHGVPMLVYRGFETDMAGNTARVVHHGLGVAGDSNDDLAEIRQHVERLLTEPSFRDAVGRFRQQYQAYERDRVAERAVTELLAQKVPGTR